MFGKWINKFAWAAISKLAPRIIDVKTGEILGSAIVVAFGTKVMVIGYRGKNPLVPVFLPEKKLCYWKMRIAFTSAEEPDYENIRENL